ncbi:MAG TPA: NAD(P)/FAD-dependent oxidoreductase [Chitinophagaceae bacterium]|nr:NAD(P)/FAD-dependent oxidoreductase [Chitinophagaceae bacterium]
MPDSATLIVAGGGAAGFFCAVNAARLNPSLKVILLEKTDKLLSKVKVSGGGRCNLTHACFDIAVMSKCYPRGGPFVKKAFHRFFTSDTIAWFKERGVATKTEKDGRMFPVTDSSQTIIDCLLKEASRYGVEIILKQELCGISRSDDGFKIQCTNGKVYEARYLCIASGGYPKSVMFDWLTATGHSIAAPVPSLFTFNLSGHMTGAKSHPLTALMGVSITNARVKIMGTKLETEGPLLITHWGLSGPAVLRLSAWAARELKEKQYVFTAQVSWITGMNEMELREEFQQNRILHAAQKITGRNNYGLATRLWEFLLLQSGVTASMRWADLPSAVQNKLIRNLLFYECPVKGKTTFKEEFVTAGGIHLTEVDPQTMMSRKLPGLFFAGEVLDVDGITGGYNFQHAWTSGWIAADAIASMSR